MTDSLCHLQSWSCLHKRAVLSNARTSRLFRTFLKCGYTSPQLSPQFTRNFMIINLDVHYSARCDYAVRYRKQSQPLPIESVQLCVMCHIHSHTLRVLCIGYTCSYTSIFEIKYEMICDCVVLWCGLCTGQMHIRKKLTRINGINRCHCE